MTIPAILVEPGSLVTGATIHLDEAEMQHLRVRRIPRGTAVFVLDGAGKRASGVIVTHGTTPSVAVEEVTVVERGPVTILAVGAGDKERFLSLAERCTELGVTALVPLETKRSLTVENRWRISSAGRAVRRSRDACKQSGNPWATVIEEPCELDQLTTRYAKARWLLADAAGDPAPKLTSAKAVGWIVGPEGGLTDAERAFCLEAVGAVATSLGSLVLRFDTAAAAAATITNDRRKK